MVQIKSKSKCNPDESILLTSGPQMAYRDPDGRVDASGLCGAACSPVDGQQPGVEDSKSISM